MSETTQLLIATLAGITVIVGLITWLRLHPVLALILGSLVVGAFAGENLNDVVVSFSTGFGDTSAGVGVLIALGAMFGKLLFDSGGADQIVDTIVRRSSNAMLPWTMAGAGALIGLPMFFEIGLVLLVPVVFLVARRAELPLMTVAIPTLAGLSVMHGFVPPHPGPLVAVDTFDANLGLTLALGIAVAIPTVIVAGPLFARFAARWVPVEAPTLFGDGEDDRRPDDERPRFVVTLFTVLLPVTLMLGAAVADVVAKDSTSWIKDVLDFVGTPLVALLIAVLVALFTLGVATGMDKAALAKTIEQSLPPIAGIILIVGAGGGFKQTLIDSGIGDVISDFAKTSSLSPLLLGWLVAALIRLATGSATVAIVTASGILVDLTSDMGSSEVSLMVLAIGAGSLIFSHVNDAGFWLIKSYFDISVVENIKTWSVMETIISVVGLALVLSVGLVI